MVLAKSMDIMNLMANTTNTIAQGEVLQLLNINDPDTTEESYHQVIYNKTACLFEAACKIGSILSDSPDTCAQSLAEYGKNLGIAFQLVDDALDYEADSAELGKNVGDDLAEGKPTLPLIYAMQKGNQQQHDLIRQAIEQGGLEHIEEITRVINETGALNYTHQQAIKHAEIAKKAIANLPDSDSKQALIFLADYAVERSY
jgi:octaprenyl-diphosphate synthase